MEWRVLIVDDLQAADVAEIIQGNKVVAQPDSISCVQCPSFADAAGRLKHERFDLVILDLKDDAAANDAALAGEAVFNELKKHRFLPVIFHTGFADKVADLASASVKVVTRGDDPLLLRDAVKQILATNLPRLVRHIEEEQRRFMWESANKIWVEDLLGESQSDLVYLLARRLANSLSGEVVRSFLASGAPKADKVHAVELYVYPPMSNQLLFGDIFKLTTANSPEYFVALTPSCDHAQKNADFVLLARCKYLKDTVPGRNMAEALNGGQDSSKTSATDISKFIRDNSTPTDRYKYLPGTSFLPDLLVDFQEITSVPVGEQFLEGTGFERVASLDSPFAEALQAKMSRYLGRIGTPDIDSDMALNRFKAKIKAA